MKILQITHLLNRAAGVTGIHLNYKPLFCVAHATDLRYLDSLYRRMAKPMIPLNKSEYNNLSYFIETINEDH